MRSSISIVLSAALSLASACKQAPSGKNVGNPIGARKSPLQSIHPSLSKAQDRPPHPSKPPPRPSRPPETNPPSLPAGLNQIVPAGVPFTITWQPTSTGPISLVLLRGPSTNVLPIACINESIPNSGSLSWTPPTSLEPDVTHYGLQIIDDGTGDYQYSTQFGISNPAYGQSTTTSSSSQSYITSAEQTTTSAPQQGTSSSAKETPQSRVTAPVSQLSDGQPQAPTSQPQLPTPSPLASPALNSTSTSTTSPSLPPSALHAYPPPLNTTAYLPVPIPSASTLLPSYQNTTSLQLTLPPSLKTSTQTAPLPSATGAGSVTVSVNVNATRTGGASTGGASTTASGTASVSVALSTGAAGRVGAGMGMGMVVGLGCVAAMVL